MNNHDNGVSQGNALFHHKIGHSAKPNREGGGVREVRLAIIEWMQVSECIQL